MEINLKIQLIDFMDNVYLIKNQLIKHLIRYKKNKLSL